MEEFSQFVKDNFSDFTLKNITNALNSRNTSSWATTINNNPEHIYFIEKKVKTVNIFRNTLIAIVVSSNKLYKDYVYHKETIWHTFRKTMGRKPGFN